MIIKKFTGKTKEEAIDLAKSELGGSVVIMNVKEVREKGFFGMFKSAQYEVTAAIEDEANRAPFKIEKAPARPSSSFTAVADEEIGFSGLTETAATTGITDTAALKDAFAEVGKIMERQQQENKPEVKPEVKPAPVSEPIAAEPVIIESKPASAPKSNPSSVANDAFIPLEDTAFVEGLTTSRKEDDQAIYKMIYRMLLDNEVDERYINQMMEDLERLPHTSNSLDVLISGIYQKMVLKLGNPDVITLTKKRPKVVFFIGPTGVGKTTTIAKLASKYKLEQECDVAFLTADTYRIAATDQLRTYANILGAPLTVIYGAEDLGKEVEKLSDYDLVLVDTAGFSHKNDEQRDDTRKLLESLPEGVESQVYLVLSSTTKYKDLIEITESYKGFCDFSIIFTKLDETSCYGNILNIKLRTGASLSYVTDGQNVPDDISVLDTQSLVKRLLGGA